MPDNYPYTDNQKYIEIKKKVEEKTTMENPRYRQQLVKAIVEFCNVAVSYTHLAATCRWQSLTIWLFTVGNKNIATHQSELRY